MSNVHKLRFKEFSGEWEEKVLKELSKVITKGTTPKKFDENGITFVKIEGISNLRINKKKCLFVSEEVHNGDLKRSKLEKDDILFAIAGSLGKVALVTADILPANTNQALSIVRLKDKDYLRYITLVLQSQRMKKYIYQNLSVGAQPNLSLEQVGKFSLFLPSKQEQEKIASFLTSVDTKIEQLTKKEKLLSSYKKGVMQKIFNQEIRFKADDGSEFCEWEEKKLGEICNKISSGKSKQVDNGRYELYGSTGVIGTTEEASNIGRYILVARVGANAGLANLVDGEFGVTDNTLVVDLKQSVDIVFVLMLLKHYNLNRLVFGSGQPLITGGELKALKMKFPCLEEQTKIANFLSSIDSKIEQVQKQLASTKEFKKALLQQMFV